MSLDVGCTIKELPPADLMPAAAQAIVINPANRVSPGKMIAVIESALGEGMADEILTPGRLAVMTRKYWGSAGVKLTVGFMDNAPADLQARIVSHMNAWGKYCNVKFLLTGSAGDAQVRIARANDGYWSYLGTDILSIPRGQPTMNLAGFTMNTRESEFIRVVRHETGHTLGFPHEHMRQQLISRLDRAKTIAYFRQTQGWSEQVTMQQVLTPLSETSIRGTPNADQDSIMCYQLPGSITIDGQPIHGGTDIDALDQAFAGELYPLAVTPPVVKVTVPNLSGNSATLAKASLAAVGLVAAFTPNETGKVASQDPAAGAQVLPNSTVTLTMSQPTPPGGPSMFMKLIAIWNAFRAKDWPLLIKLVLEIIADQASGKISAQELADCDAAMAQMQQAMAALKATKKP